ncbi:MAG TPA: SDR family NAD(P)-dependent oxidoreductase [Steroidobacteraceae bacterium]|nr:SDR family NAD(P)-dependent oxidoreductase [Steroidobacteraceae bacterium]
MIDLSGRVAIVTGAGGGLGRSHAHLLAQRGARVVVNDLGAEAESVAQEITAAGGRARAAIGSVTDAARMQAMVEKTLEEWQRVDILVNNAGILRDKTFAKMSLEEFRLVLEVHLMGAVHCTKAVWEAMRRQNYGRIVMTTSSSGLYGNFGQSNYGAAKLALVGLMQTLALEGAKYGIHVNCIAPSAATQMLEGILPAQQLALLRPELVSPAVLALVSEQAPTRAVVCAGAGGFEIANVTLTEGIMISGDPPSAETLLERWAEVSDRRGEIVPAQGAVQAQRELKKAGFDA